MTRRIAVIFASLVATALALGCTEESSDEVEYELQSLVPGGFDGVDLLIAVDDSVSMAEEQAILATSFFPLVNALASPIQTDYPETDWPYPAADELRIAVVTSNMGLSAFGAEMDGYWPGDVPPECAGRGDDGVFQGFTLESVTVQNDVIPCAATAAQCPAGWTCADIAADTGVGVCHTDDATAVECPGVGSSWAEATDEAPNPQLAIQASCLSQQGIDGCEFEQPLQSAATALLRADQEEFLHDSHLLAIVVVSDEDDCSIENAWIAGEDVGLFEEDEVVEADAGQLDLACGDHPEDLFPTGHFYDAFVEAKGPSSVMFVAIAGVPYGAEAGAPACQGAGDQLGECLAQDEMQLTPEQPNLPDDAAWHYHPACTRSVGETEVARATPGRRYVELANESFGNMGYVYSICNADWSPAMAEIARTIAPAFAGACLENRIAWDPTSEVAACEVTVEYLNEGETCPEIFGPDAVPVIETETSSEGEEIVRMYCPIPAIPFAQECADQVADGELFGWYYCENFTGEFTCPYLVGLTRAVVSAVAGRQIDVKCEIADDPAE